MSSTTTTTSDTDAIDKKKGEDTESNKESFMDKLKAYLKTIGGRLLTLIIYFCLGGLILFSCKVAQSNILPTDVNCAPYTSQQPEFVLPKDSKNLINIFKSAFFDPDTSEKIYFAYEQNAKSTVLDLIKSYKDKPDGSNIGHYFVSFIEKITAFLFYFVGVLLSFINRLPETLIILCGPIAFLFLIPLIAFVGVIYSLILWFTEMKWFFKVNTNETNEGLPKFEDASTLTQKAWAWFLVIVACWGAFFLLMCQGYTVIVFSLLTFVTGVILTFTGNMNGKQVSVLSIIKDVFRYYKVIITVMISYFVITNAFDKLGSVPGVFSLLTVALIYLGIIGINIYQPIDESNMTPIVSDDQFIKKCALPKGMKKPASFWQSLFSGGGKGARELVKDIKKVGKQIKKH